MVWEIISENIGMLIRELGWSRKWFECIYVKGLA